MDELTPLLAVLGVGVLLTVALRTLARGVVVAAPLADVVPHAGGLPPLEHPVSRFHVRWYVVTMVFLAFDMEMIFMYPWTLVVAQRGPAAVIEMFGFLALLVAGVLYAWREGALRWT
ncbi:NADH-quinone oxidoreductase subunit A [Actinomycetospora straminea]|uniref:NADH-quinone oxidoreductase subunit n=1 Tax=Actinomycetospora straminea TaxID=663607 RepID=A0ABP9DYN3_9PSEU|nr:NADH-quinone oxidoreductase subunit A [Actinomycetospora straminea]MDD7934208.1 NADH-quinone oxidoreductase subunit A [Actinomycetospora straminea]